MVDTVAHAFVRSVHTRTISVPGHANARVEGVVTFTAAVKSLFANILNSSWMAVKDGGGISTQHLETFVA